MILGRNLQVNSCLTNLQVKSGVFNQYLHQRYIDLSTVDPWTMHRKGRLLPAQSTSAYNLTPQKAY